MIGAGREKTRKGGRDKRTEWSDVEADGATAGGGENPQSYMSKSL